MKYLTKDWYAESQIRGFLVRNGFELHVLFDSPLSDDFKIVAKDVTIEVIEG